MRDYKMICKTHKIASAILISLMVMVILLSPNTAKADNDDLAFDFINAPVNAKVHKCYVFGNINTFEFEKVKYLPKNDVHSCEHIKEIVSELSQEISALECFREGIYTKAMFARISANEELDNYDAADFYDLGDFCQQVYEELYPQEYDDNKLIRGVVK